MNNLIWWN